MDGAKRAREWWPVLALALLATVVTAVVSATFFPDGTLNLDEVAYEAQANGMVDGRLTLPVDEFVPSFRPYLSGIDGTEVVFKYQPLWPALLAASKVIGGGTLLIRLVFSFLGVVACAAFTYELVQSRRVAMIAAALFALSPFVWLQSSSILGYHPSLVLLLGGAALLLRAARVDRAWLAVGGGLVLGAAFLHRPFDAVIAAVPLIVYLALLVPRRRLLPMAAAVAAGVLPFVVVMLVYNTATMGSPLRMPFNAAGGLDYFGFGQRASFVSPGSETIDFTAVVGLESGRDSLWALPVFVFAWPAVLGLAGYGVWRHRRERAAWLLVAIVLVTFGGYVFWWGSSNLIDFRLHELLGPSYHYVVLVPFVVLAAWGASDLVDRRATGVLAGVLVVGLAVGVPMSVIMLTNAYEMGETRAEDVAMFDGSGKRVMLTKPSFVGDPYVHWANDGLLQSDMVVALDLNGERLNLLSRYPDRQIVVVRSLRARDDLFGDARVERVPLEVEEAGEFELAISPAGSPRQEVRAFFDVDGARALADGDAGRWTLRPQDLPADRAVSVALGLAEVNPFAEPEPDDDLSSYECRLEARRLSDTRLQMTTTCDYVHYYVFPDGKTTEAGEDVSSLLDVTIQPR